MGAIGEQMILFFPVASRNNLAKTQVMPSKITKVNRGCKVREQDYSMKCAGLFPKSDQNILLPKMSRIFLELTGGGILAQYSPNYPEWGTMQNGEFAERQMLVPAITGEGCISLVTPMASDCNRGKLSFPMYTRRHHRSAGSLPEHLYKLFGAVPGHVNHQLYAWMMGFPVTYLDFPKVNSEGSN